VEELQKEGFAYKDFKGAPYFAVDVTPRGAKAGVAEELIKKVTERGFTFKEATLRNMGLQAGQGQFTFVSYCTLRPSFTQHVEMTAQ
jgi:NAD+ diphosphatase